MARRDPYIAPIVHKEVWDHFKAKEMEILAAYAYAFDGIWPYRKQSVDKEKGEIKYEEKPLPPYRREMAHNPRPWSCYERFLRAVTAFTRVMDDNPSQNLKFAIAFLESDGTITSRDVQLEESETRRSREIYFEICGKNGFAWGNESKLKEYAAGYGGQMCRKFGFKEVDAPPFDGEIGELTSSGSFTDVIPDGNLEPEGNLNASSETVAIRRRGRPPKVSETTGVGADD